MFLIIIPAGLLTFAFCTFPLLNSGFAETWLRFTVAGTVGSYTRFPFHSKILETKIFAKIVFFICIHQNQTFLYKTCYPFAIYTKERPLSILKTAIHPLLYYLYMLFFNEFISLLFSSLHRVLQNIISF